MLRRRGLLHLHQDLLGGVGEEEIQDADGVTPIGDGRQDPLTLPAVRRQNQALVAQDIVVNATAGRRNPRRAVFLLLAGGVVDAEQAPADDIDEQERHVTSAEPVPQTRHRVEGVHRRRGLRRRQHLRPSDPLICHISLQKGLRALLPDWPTQSQPRQPGRASAIDMPRAPPPHEGLVHADPSSV